MEDTWAQVTSPSENKHRTSV